ncbi:MULTISPECIES: DUF2142 domain-containing protein [unclassified Frigoribacterium]|uniref:DUF2142 domain-containing protein n=1 Tax=unclassified Frigoribacterium TaxID=2627005 RepID=UPI0006F4AA8A|nr:MULTISPECIES: DUF2142 domain-containing protein [unclassified Frigoribacterium]KQM25568.1 hypothetical protein ASL10_08500 [Frigoribacterium sp. Leaf8]WAC51011.1 DUF2142 domain-containing protein [Frigoribacterium sp. SL97]
MNVDTRTASQPSRSKGRSRRPLTTFLLSFVAFCLLGGTWAMANPLMSLPDEPAHTIHAAAVVRGEWSGTPTGKGGWTDVEVPEYIAIAHDLPCFAFRNAESAQCQMLVPDSEVETTVTTSAGSYDPAYYAVVGLPSLVLDGKASYYGMRGVSVMLVSAFLALAVVALSQLRRRGFALLALAVAITPKVLFLASGINPNSLEIASAVMLFSWLSLLAQRWREDGVPPVRIAMVAVAAVALANSRSIGPLYVLIIVLATLFDLELVKRLLRSRAFWVGVVAIGVGTAFSLAWTVLSASLSVSTESAGTGTGFGLAFRTMAFLTFENLTGYVGIFGWQEVPAPFTTVAIWGGLMFALAVAGLFLGRGRPRRTVLLLILAFLFIPPLMQGYAAADYGYIWQARYLLAIVCPLVIAGGIALDDAFPTAFTLPGARRLAGFVLVILAIMQFHTYVWNLQRYVLGMPDGWSRMFTDPEWLPPGGWYIWAAVLLVTLVGGAVLLGRAAFSPMDDVPATDAPSLGASDRADTRLAEPAVDDRASSVGPPSA